MEHGEKPFSKDSEAYAKIDIKVRNQLSSYIIF
jgi:hypothetical protein